MNRFLQVALSLCLLGPVRAEAGLRFWTRSEAALKQVSEKRLDIQIKDATTTFHVRLREVQDGTSVDISDGRRARHIGLAGPLVKPGSRGWYCVREHEGEGTEGDIALSLQEIDPHGPMTIPVGQAEMGEWKLWLLQWDSGGCGIAGMFSSNLILAQHKPTGTWAARVDMGVGFHELPGKSSKDPTFLFVPARRTPNNCWVNIPWAFQVHQGKARVTTGTLTYQWFVGATVADTPRHARHWGHQEVAWHVASVEAHGGVAEAFAASPRLESDFDGVLPAPGRVPFLWRAMVVAAGKDGHYRFIDARKAGDLARTGQWDVVLEKRHGKVLATWVVEHDHDFPHCTPTRLPR